MRGQMIRDWLHYVFAGFAAVAAAACHRENPFLVIQLLMVQSLPCSNLLESLIRIQLCKVLQNSRKQVESPSLELTSTRNTKTCLIEV